MNTPPTRSLKAPWRPPSGKRILSR